MKKTQRVKIMLVDDDPEIVEALSLVLKMNGYMTVFATEDSFFEVLKKEKPKLVLLDVFLAGASGVKLCADLKSKKNLKEVPVVLLSAGDDLAELAKTAGADGFVKKPFELRLLIENIEKFL